jgi:hypothetical protein
MVNHEGDNAINSSNELLGQENIVVKKIIALISSEIPKLAKVSHFSKFKGWP